LFYSGLVYEGEHAGVVRADLVDSMAVIRHGETSPHANKHLCDGN